MGRLRSIVSVFVIFAILATSPAETAIIADHSAAANFSNIPTSYIESITTAYNIYYVHTSHGSQIVTGINMLYDENNLYDPPDFYEVGDDLGHVGDITWVQPARDYLGAHPECNMAMFSWCGGCSDNTEEGIDIYLEQMNTLEADYPDVVFIYMTGHLDGTGPTGNLYVRNNQIRDYCIANDKILFDFADIESYDPNGAYYPDESDACNWCYDWCALYSCPACVSCAHSHCFSCYLKGRAWWWMMALITGWSPGETSCGDADGDGNINVLDVTFIINFLYKGGPEPDPVEMADVNNSGSINILDITTIINFLYKSGSSPNCP